MIREPTSVRVAVIRKMGLFCSLALSAVAGFALTVSVFIESFHSARLAAVLVVLILLHLMRFQRLFVSREMVSYAIFICYMLFQLLWTTDIKLSMNTLVPAASVLLTMVFFGSLMFYHDSQAVLSGILIGFISSAIFYTLTVGFPFSYPASFSYNAIASMYLFGLIITLLLSCFSRLSALFVIIGLVSFLHIVATTSIKTNLGILLGVTGGGLIYFKYVSRIVRKNAMLLIALVSAFAYTLASNAVLLEALKRGIDRINLGLNLLQARSDLPGYSAMSSREAWSADGLQGWAQNPVFGNGVEAFRSQFGITSHSTPIDLLYNSGLIGFCLFYAIFISFASRLYAARSESASTLHFLLFAALLCYFFVSLSGIVHANSLLAAVVAIGVALLGKFDSQRLA